MEVIKQMERFGARKAMERFEARKRTALDGRVWWCVYDKERHAWSTFLCHGRYKTRKACEQAIISGEIKI